MHGSSPEPSGRGMQLLDLLSQARAAPAGHGTRSGVPSEPQQEAAGTAAVKHRGSNAAPGVAVDPANALAARRTALLGVATAPRSSSSSASQHKHHAHGTSGSVLHKRSSSSGASTRGTAPETQLLPRKRQARATPPGGSAAAAGGGLLELSARPPPVQQQQQQQHLRPSTSTTQQRERQQREERRGLLHFNHFADGQGEWVSGARCARCAPS